MNKQDIKNFTAKLKRDPESHKYDYGHVLVIAGSKNMPGAGVLCCNSAMRSGAGLVTYAVRESFLSSACAMSKPETMFFVYKTAADILKFIKSRKVSSVVIGPGLAADSKLRSFILKIITSVNIPVILDASGISAFNNDYAGLKKAKAKLILTPHACEFSKLTGMSAPSLRALKGRGNPDNKTVVSASFKHSGLLRCRCTPPRNDDKESAVKEFAKKCNLICLLKGRNTIVSDGENTYINKTGTPAMATAGSGDVLSGAIAAFAGINPDLFEAVKFAVFIHGLAGEISEKDKGAAGVIASDISENMCYAVKQLTKE
ncbi:MAG: NAD(P)H-hydrate dehydratase [Endomicrobia bacterium]|nr:NAD(P)H-hydrate dehydratase [Endomicrobiia bacterium]